MNKLISFLLIMAYFIITPSYALVSTQYPEAPDLGATILCVDLTGWKLYDWDYGLFYKNYNERKYSIKDQNSTTPQYWNTYTWVEVTQRDSSGRATHVNLVCKVLGPNNACYRKAIYIGIEWIAGTGTGYFRYEDTRAAEQFIAGVNTIAGCLKK